MHTRHAQYGICGAVAVEEYATGVIKRHEKTQVKKENDRTRLTFTQVRMGSGAAMHPAGPHPRLMHRLNPHSTVQPPDRTRTWAPCS